MIPMMTNITELLRRNKDYDMDKQFLPCFCAVCNCPSIHYINSTAVPLNRR